jgi:hypothetical protein
MSLIVPSTFVFDSQNHNEIGNKSPSIRSTLSTATYQASLKNSPSPSLNTPITHRQSRLQAGPSILDISSNLSDDENDFDDNASARENYRFAPQYIRTRYSRHNSISLATTTNQRHIRPSTRDPELLVIQAPRPGTGTIPGRYTSYVNHGYTSMVEQQAAIVAANLLKEVRGQTLLHLAASLGHDEIMRLLISETSQAGMLMNKQGQTPLLTAIEAGSTSTATLLMESDPRSIVASDVNGSSVFHYACENCNDVVLHRAINLSKRLNSTNDRITVC